jgi:hypothetical protein
MQRVARIALILLLDLVLFLRACTRALARATELPTSAAAATASRLKLCVSERQVHLPISDKVTVRKYVEL